jgi:hypothetical protein
MVDFREKLATVAETQPAEEPNAVAPAASDALVLPQQND